MSSNPFDRLTFLHTPATDAAQPASALTASPDPSTQPIPAVAAAVPAALPSWLTPATPTVAPTIPSVVPAAGDRTGWDPEPFPAVAAWVPPGAAAPLPAAPEHVVVGTAWSDPYSDAAIDEFTQDHAADRSMADDAGLGSGLVRIVRRVLGLDRASKNRAGSTGSDWLDDGQDELPARPNTAARPARAEEPADIRTSVPTSVSDDHDHDPVEVGEGRPAEQSRRPRTPVATDSVAVSDGQRSWPAKAGRWAIWAVVGLIFFAGVNQVILRPVFGSSGQDVAEQGPAVDLSAAQAAAIRYALDYFSYSPDTAAAGTAALRADADSSTVKRWTGTGYLASDSAAAGPMVIVDDTTALVPVTLRIRLAMPPTRAIEPAAPAAATSLTDPSDTDAATPPAESATPSNRPTPSAATAAPSVPGGAAGDPGQIPAGWTDLGSRWVTVSVPVRAAADGSVKATGGGAVLVGEGVTAAVGTVDPMADSDLSSSTNTAVDRFFTGYAASDTSYVSAPGVDMAGLNGVVTVGDRTRWSADLPATTGSASTTPTEVTQLTGTAGVTWQLTGTDLAIVQTYRAAMTLSQGRWYVAQLAPSFTNQ